MKQIITMLSILTVLFFLSYCTGKKGTDETTDQATKNKELSQDELVKRGEYLVNVGGCNDCHSPKNVSEKGFEIIKETMLSGYPADRPIQKPDKKVIGQGWYALNVDMTQAAGPWGISFSANLTPDPTGIGSWSFEQFKKAMTEGKFKGMDGGRMLLPPMPWQNFTNMEEDDLQAIFAYLKSIKPVNNLVPAPIPPTEL
jgi:hypothetical protein